MNTRSAPYSALVSSICDEEPRHGWMSAQELPTLTAEDAALVCREYPREVDEVLADSHSVTASLEHIRSADVAALGLQRVAAIAEAARQVVWHDVQEEIERRAEDERRERDQAEYNRSAGYRVEA